MRRVAIMVLTVCGVQAAAAQSDTPIPVPSGQTVNWLDTIQDAPGPEGLTVRHRFVAPAIAREGGTVTPEQAQQDMAFLCDSFAIPRLTATGPMPAQIVISLSDRPVPFGEPSEDATQFFEAYRPGDGICIWEPY